MSSMVRSLGSLGWARAGLVSKSAATPQIEVTASNSTTVLAIITNAVFVPLTVTNSLLQGPIATDRPSTLWVVVVGCTTGSSFVCLAPWRDGFLGLYPFFFD